MKKNLSIIPAFIIMILAVVVLGFIAKAQVPTPNTLGSWAWSSNIGWIDFRDVKVDQATGLLSGYGWSSNIGWVKFHGLSQYPSGGAPGEPARIDFATGKVYGWVRACAGTIGGETPTNGANCSSMNSRSDGWDGWIELSDAVHSPSRLKYDTVTGNVTGMAWGGPVIGWLQFGAIIQPIQPQVLSGNCTGSSDSNGNLTFVATASGGSGNYLYDWDEADEFSANNIFVSPYNANTPSRTVFLVIKDATSRNDVRPQCPIVTRTVIEVITGKVLDLKIGSSGLTANATSVRVRKGSSFGLRWENTLPIFSNVYINELQNPDGYFCTRSIPIGEGVNWNNVWAGDINQSGYISGLNTSETGRFTFMIHCFSTKYETKEASVLLNVVSSTEQET